LIPRPETEAYTSHLASLIEQRQDFKGLSSLRILDLCTGTGCIPLLLHDLLAPSFPDLQLLGVDISNTALRLSDDNLWHNIGQRKLDFSASDQVSFLNANVLTDTFLQEDISHESASWDIVISNPPYISEAGFTRDTSRSVRTWEPKLALVPPLIKGEHSLDYRAEDSFYPAILHTALAAQAKVVLMEVADTEQALRVCKVALDMSFWKRVEVWRDWPDQDVGSDEQKNATLGRHQVTFKGSGHGRAVVCWKD